MTTTLAAALLIALWVLTALDAATWKHEYQAQLAANASLQRANASVRHECRGPMPWEGKP